MFNPESKRYIMGLLGPDATKELTFEEFKKAFGQFL